ncbi:MAG: ribose-phosphate pyrophosphokinase [Planctomycetota bacterium]
MDSLRLFSGTANPALTKGIADFLGIPLGKAAISRFPDGETLIKVEDDVRGYDVFIVQSTSPPVNEHLMELLIFIDCVRRASALRVTAVIPYFGYARQDRKDEGRVPITAKLSANLLTVAGASRILTLDLHAAQIQGFFNIPVDELTALYLIGDHFAKKNFDSDLVVVASDIGISKRARDLAERLNAPLAIMEKRRLGNKDQAETLNVIGEVEGKIARTVDDEIDTAGSLVGVVAALIQRGVKEVYACCTHPIFSGPAVQRIAASPVKEVVVTDTVPVKDGKKIDKITVLPIAPLLGEAIHRIHTGLSIGAMFD